MLVERHRRVKQTALGRCWVSKAIRSADHPSSAASSWRKDQKAQFTEENWRVESATAVGDLGRLFLAA